MIKIYFTILEESCNIVRILILKEYMTNLQLLF